MYNQGVLRIDYMNNVLRTIDGNIDEYEKK